MAKGNRPLLGGVGDAPAGRGGIADQLFQAREGIPIRDKIARAVAGTTEDDVLPPTPNNRGIETFNTVRESLASSLGVNAADNNKKKDLVAAVDSMLQLIDEGDPARISPDEVERYGQVVRAYQDAFNLQAPEQQAAILSVVPPARQQEFQAFFGGNFARSALEQTAQQQATPGMRRLMSQTMDLIGDEDQYVENNRRLGRTVGDFKPYERTDEGRDMQRILGVLLDEYGLDPAVMDRAMIGDAGIAPFDPGPGVNLTRDAYPARERLSSYIGPAANDGSMRYRGGSEDVNEGWIGRELLGQYEAAMNSGDNVVPRIVDTSAGKIDSPTPDMILTSFDLNDTDPTVRSQMTPEITKVRDEIHNRVIGAATGPMDLERLAPWINGTTQQAIDGKVVRAGFLADQIVDTILSQSQYAAEVPYIREIARERLLPQVELAIQLRREQGIEPTKRYDRNASGRRLLIEDGAVEAPAPAPKPAATGGVSIEQIKESLKRSAGAKTNDMGFSQPMQMPRYMASAMPNRMLAGLLG